MNNINDLKDLMRELEESLYYGNQIPIDCVNYINEWLRLNDGEEYNTKDWKAESEYYKSEYEDLKTKYEELKVKYEDLEHEYDHLEFDCEVLENSNNSLKEWNNSIKQKYDEMTTSFLLTILLALDGKSSPFCWLQPIMFPYFPMFANSTYL